MKTDRPRHLRPLTKGERICRSCNQRVSPFISIVEAKSASFASGVKSLHTGGLLLVRHGYSMLGACRGAQDEA